MAGGRGGLTGLIRQINVSDKFTEAVVKIGDTVVHISPMGVNVYNDSILNVSSEPANGYPPSDDFIRRLKRPRP